MLVLHEGRKRWWLYPPGTRPVPRNHHPLGMANGWAPPAAGLQGAYSEQLSVCDQNPGDVVFLPSGWHHATLNLGGGSSATTLGVALQARVPTDALGRDRQLANILVDMINAAGNRSTTAASKALSKLLERWPTDPELLYAHGNALLQKAGRSLGDAAKAAKMLKQSRRSLRGALNKDANDDRAALALCRAVFETLTLAKKGAGSVDSDVSVDAARACPLVPRLNPYSDLPWFYAGRFADAVGDVEGAVDAYRRATKLNPESPTAWCVVL
jgi:tetratricopeptide (TPR) repeat protein